MLVPEFSYPSRPKTKTMQKAIKKMLAKTSFCFKKPEMLYNITVKITTKTFSHQE